MYSIWIDCLLACLFIVCFFISFKFQSITDRLLQSMEARNQSVDDLLLEIDQSIAVSRHTMRYSFFGDDKYNEVIIKCPLIVLDVKIYTLYAAWVFELTTCGFFIVFMQSIVNSLFFL